MNVEKGDLVRLEYSAKTEGVLFDTTSAEEAKAAGVYNPKGSYGSVLVAVGKKQVVPGLDEALEKAEEKKPTTIVLSPDKAFGLRDPNAVSLVPLQRFRDQDVEPYPGMVLDFDGRPARVQSVSGGRVRVDFNSDLAGKQVEYLFTVQKIFKTSEEKVQALAEEANLKASLKDGEVFASFEASQKTATEWAVKKIRFMHSCFNLLEGVKRVRFEETYVP